MLNGSDIQAFDGTVRGRAKNYASSGDFFEKPKRDRTTWKKLARFLKSCQFRRNKRPVKRLHHGATVVEVIRSLALALDFGEIPSMREWRLHKVVRLFDGTPRITCGRCKAR